MIRVFALTAMGLAVIVVLLRPTPALAEPPNGKATPVYVLSVWTNDVDDQADALTQALRSRVRQAPGWSLVDTNQSFETLSIALRCPPTPNQLCLDKIGDQLHTDHYIWGTIAKEKSGEVNAEVRLWSRGKPQVEASESYSENLKDPSEDSLRAVAGRLLAKLTGTGSSGGATLVVHAGSAGGSVVVDGVTKGKLDGGVARVDIAGGSHTVAVRVPGSTSPAQSVSMPDGGEQEVTFALTPAASPEAPAAASAEAGATAAPSEPEVRHAGFPVRKVLGYTAVVVGAGFLVAAGYEGAQWLSDKNDSDTARANVPNTITDVCAAGIQDSADAQKACKASQDATDRVKLGWIFAGVGAVLAGTGIWLVVGDHSGDAPTEPAVAARRGPKLDVLPSFGPRAGNVDVRLTF
jgi:hypothetical protein